MYEDFSFGGETRHKVAMEICFPPLTLTYVRPEAQIKQEFCLCIPVI